MELSKGAGSRSLTRLSRAAASATAEAPRTGASAWKQLFAAREGDRLLEGGSHIGSWSLLALQSEARRSVQARSAWERKPGTRIPRRPTRRSTGTGAAPRATTSAELPKERRLHGRRAHRPKPTRHEHASDGGRSRRNWSHPQLAGSMPRPPSPKSTHSIPIKNFWVGNPYCTGCF